MPCPDRLLIPYGVSRLMPRFFSVVRTADGSERVRCSIAHAVVRPAGCPSLRLSDAGALVTRPAAAPNPVDAVGTVSVLRAAFEELCGLWWPVGRRFVALYFELAERLVDEHRHELEAKLAEFGDLYEYRDWIYSAPAPLPRAWIPVNEAQAPAAAPESFVACDFAFWTGDAVTAVFVTGTETLTPARLERTRRLRNAGVGIHEIPAAAMETQGPDALRERMPAAFLRSWERERYPSGPSWTDMAGELED